MSTKTYFTIINGSSQLNFKDKGTGGVGGQQWHDEPNRVLAEATSKEFHLCGVLDSKAKGWIEYFVQDADDAVLRLEVKRREGGNEVSCSVSPAGAYPCSFRTKMGRNGEWSECGRVVSGTTDLFVEVHTTDGRCGQ